MVGLQGLPSSDAFWHPNVSASMALSNSACSVLNLVGTPR